MPGNAIVLCKGAVTGPLLFGAGLADEGRDPIKVAPLVRVVSVHDGYDSPGVMLFCDGSLLQNLG